MRSIKFFLLLAATTSCTSAITQAGIFSQCGERTRCCPPVCQVECECKEVDVDCWEVDCKNVCVPPVQLPNCFRCCSSTCSPCQDNCVAGDHCCGEDSSPGMLAGCGSRMMKCLFGKFAKGRVRCVSRLRKSSYKTRKPDYTWSVRQNGCGGCSTGDCCE